MVPSISLLDFSICFLSVISEVKAWSVVYCPWVIDRVKTGSAVSIPYVINRAKEWTAL